METTMYTRQQQDEPDKRGESMVAKHYEKLAAAKEAAALEKLHAVMPHLGLPIKVTALTESGADGDSALALLRKFGSACSEKLAALAKRRQKILEAIKEVQEGKENVAVPVVENAEASTSGSDSSTDTDSDDKRKHKKKASKHKKDRSKKSKEKSKKRKHSKKKESRKRSKKDAHSSDSEPLEASKKALASSHDFGKYGILREADINAKRSEFQMWAMEVKKMDVEVMPKYEERDLFREYLEDFNTGTLPHRKYYDIEAYEQQKRAKAAEKAARERRGDGRSVKDDEETLRRERAEAKAKLSKDRLAEAYASLVTDNDKASGMREQELLRRQMALAYQTGDTAKARQLMERLAPDKEPPK